MKTPKEKSNKGLIIALIVVGTLFLLLCAAFVYFYFFQSNELSIFNVDDVDPSIANKLSGSIVYSSDREGESEYFSPSLELTFTYDEEVFSITEATTAVSINPRNYEEYTTAYLRVSQSTDIKGLLLETSYYEDLKVESEDTEGEVKKILFTYSKPSLVNPDKSATEYISVFYRTFNDSETVYIEVKDFNYTENSALATSLEGIINTTSFDISEVDQELQAQIDEGTVNISFDRTHWSISYQTQQSMTMMGEGANKGSFSVSLMPVYSLETVETQEALEEQIKEHFEMKGEYFVENEYLFEQVGEFESVTVGGVDFVKGTYKFNYGMEPNNIESYYIGYLSGKELEVTMTTRYTDDNEGAAEYIDTLLEGIEINDDEIYGALGENVLGTSNVSINPATVLGQASTVRIYNSECNDYSFSSLLTGLNLAGQTYTLCTAGLGSGFVVDDLGNVVTNAHVADPNNFIVMMYGMSNNTRFLDDLLDDVLTALADQYGAGSLQYLGAEQLTDYALSFIYNIQEEGYLTVNVNERELYVQGNEPFSFNQTTGDLINASSHYPATLVDSNEITSGIEYYFDQETKYTDVADIAVINVGSTFNLPSIPVTSEGLVTGQPIYVIGYPGLVDNEMFIDTSVIYGSTVTQGNISAIKPNSNNTFDLLQIDASVEHGNSGGPIVADDGSVVGIATYGLAPSESGNYNAGVAAGAVKDFLAQSAITATPNEERLTLEEAMLDISKSYYSRAKEKLQTLVDNQDSLGVIINPFIELCDSKIAAGEDKTPMFDLDFSNWQTVIIPLMVLILIVMVVILVLLMVRKKKNKKGNDAPPVDSNPQPATQVQQ